MDESCLSNVIKLFSEFEIPMEKVGRRLFPLDEKDCTTYYKAFSSFHENLRCMRQLLGLPGYSYSSVIVQLAFDDNFKKNLHEIISF